MTLKKPLGLLLFALTLAPLALHAEAPKLGMYMCYGRSTSGPSFALLTAKTYRSRSGKTGDYTYNDRTGELTLITGPLEGTIYRLTDGAFRVLRDNAITEMSCPYVAGKDPNQPW